ncbi:homoserine dehydrogenase [Pseudalkalibacillus sp. SCS-8]|uniref:homoserine dehydrogenase n=1 Tax=Pseudalkalibacillus nanhaiensis TaxID=3115291 RepID=UPI0032DBDEE5
MANLKVALLGFGTVGSGVYEIIQSQQQRLNEILGRKVEVVAVLIQDEKKQRTIGDKVLVTSDIQRILQFPDLDVVIEAIVGVEPGYSYLKQVLEKGCHVVTANKELFAHKGAELKALATANQVTVSFEASVAGGIPIIGTLNQLLQGNQITKIEAILNGTSNYILSQIRQKEWSFREALSAAQTAGYAEANPSNDVDGHDTFFKIIILAELLFRIKPDWRSIVRKGIRHITSRDIQLAEIFGFRIKHVATLVWNDRNVHISVEPKVVSSEHPLYEVEGVDNALVLSGDLVGDIKLQGPGAGKFPTASAIIEDLINIYKRVSGERLQNEAVLEVDRYEERSSWFVIGKTNQPIAGQVKVEKTVQLDGTIHTVRFVKATRSEIEKITREHQSFVAYPISGSYSTIIDQASVTA